MRGLAVVVSVALAGCALGIRGADPYAPVHGVEITAGPGGVPDVRCAGEPGGAAREFRHLKSRIIAALGRPDHRGIDVIATEGADQRIAGRLGYNLSDKKLEDEDVDLFACDAGGWRSIGIAHTDGEGGFELALTGPARMPIGLRDLYASVVGDRSGVRFLAYVAPAGTKLVVSDVDGTLTASENAFPKAVFLGGDVASQTDAAHAFQTATAGGYQLVYVTARGDRFTGATRQWLGAHGFPRGPLRLASGLLTLPGTATVSFKTQVLRALSHDFVIAAGIGNRASDVTAYRAAGVPADRIFIKLPEFTGELSAALDQRHATGIASYATLALP